MRPKPTTHLLVIGEREALVWILRSNRMAFPAARGPRLNHVTPGDRLLLMTSRGCYHNPGRDRTRVIGTATVTSLVTHLEEPVLVAGRQFDYGCELAIQSLAPYGGGVELAPLVPELAVFTNKRAWAAKLRRPLVTLGDPDAALLSERLSEYVNLDLAEARESYFAAIKPLPRTQTASSPPTP